MPGVFATEDDRGRVYRLAVIGLGLRLSGLGSGPHARGRLSAEHGEGIVNLYGHRYSLCCQHRSPLRFT
jgi:hypothetical protein